MKKKITILNDRAGQSVWTDKVSSHDLVWGIWGLASQLENIFENEDPNTAMCIGCAMHALAAVMLDRLDSMDAPEEAEGENSQEAQS